MTIPDFTRDADAMERAAQVAIERFGSVDIWVNDAGIYPSPPFLELDDVILDKVLDTNLLGVINGSRYVPARMAGLRRSNSCTTCFPGC